MLLIFFLFLLPYIGGVDMSQAECKVSAYGKEFVFGFVDIPYYTEQWPDAQTPNVSVIVATRYSTTVYVTLQSTNSASKTPKEVTTQYYINKGREISFNSSFINQYNKKSTGGVIKVTSDDPISLMTVYKFSGYQENHIKVSPIFPTNALSTTYIIPSFDTNTKYHGKNEFMVIGINDSTSVRFEGYETGSMVHTVDHNDVLIYQREVDISSTSAHSNYPIPIFTTITSGQSRTITGLYNRSLTMHVPPLDRNALHFIVPSLSSNSVDRYTVRIYASSSNAFVEIHSTSDKTENVHVYNKIYYEMSAEGSDILEILSDSPLVVVQIAKDSYGNSLYMTEIPAVSQYLTLYNVRFPSGISVSPNTSIVVTISSKEVSGLLIDRKPVIHDSSQLTKSPLGNYTVISLSTSSTVSVTHVGSEKFGVIALGTWRTTTKHDITVTDAFGFQAGMQFTKTDCGSVQPSGPIIG